MCKANVIFSILISIIVSACGGGGGGGENNPGGGGASVLPDTDTNTDTGQALGAVFTDALWNRTVLPVCWAMPKEDIDLYADKRELVRQSIMQSWEKASAVKFTGWEQCDSNVAEIVISIGFEENKNAFGYSKYGVYSLSAYPSMALRFNGIDDLSLEATAVHEFGHALGFAHAQDRPDTPQWCIDYVNARYPNSSESVPDPSIEAHTMVFSGPWDSQSIMSYCNTERHFYPQLSDIDKATVSFYYGPPTP